MSCCKSLKITSFFFINTGPDSCYPPLHWLNASWSKLNNFGYCLIQYLFGISHSSHSCSALFKYLPTVHLSIYLYLQRPAPSQELPSRGWPLQKCLHLSLFWQSQHTQSCYFQLFHSNTRSPYCFTSQVLFFPWHPLPQSFPYTLFTNSFSFILITCLNHLSAPRFTHSTTPHPYQTSLTPFHYFQHPILKHNMHVSLDLGSAYYGITRSVFSSHLLFSSQAHSHEKALRGNATP